MERRCNIKTPDKKVIYGILSIVPKKSDTLVIFVHGFTDYHSHHLFFNGAHFLNQKGFDVFRFNLYGWQKEARHLNDTSIQIWGADITTILKNFRKKYKKIFVVGHSFGGTALLFADSNFADGFIFLDATYVQAKDNWFGGVYYRQVKGYIVSGGISHFLSKKFVDTFNHFPDCGKCISQIHKPVCFIVAGRLGNMKAGKKYFAKANQPKKLITISGADHNFDNFKHEQKVFDVINWFIK